MPPPIGPSAQPYLGTWKPSRAALQCGDSSAVSLKVVLVSGVELPEVRLESSSSVLDAKCTLEPIVGAPAEYQRLLHGGQELEDHWTLAEEWRPELVVNLVYVAPNAPSILGVSEIGSPLLAQYLLRCSANPNELGGDGLPELHAAARDGQQAIFDALVDLTNSTGINKADEDGQTVLHMAASFGNRSMYESILRRHDFAVVNRVDVEGRTALHCAAAGGHVEACKAILGHAGFQGSNWPDSYGFTALELALASDCAQDFRKLLVATEGRSR